MLSARYMYVTVIDVSLANQGYIYYVCVANLYQACAKAPISRKHPRMSNPKMSNAKMSNGVLIRTVP